MDQLTQDQLAPGLIVRRLPADPPPAGDLPGDFLPLRLLFHPGRLCLEICKADMLLGRHSHADIRLSLPDISRRHCRFRFRDGHWEVADLDSLNGIFINGERLQESVLCPGDSLSIGSLTFVVELLGQESRDKYGQDEKMPTAVLKSIAEVLPRPKAPRTEQYRRVS